MRGIGQTIVAVECLPAATVDLRPLVLEMAITKADSLADGCSGIGECREIGAPTTLIGPKLRNQGR